jgi:acetoin utilization deacetylase AcuC-like enzyme
MIHGAPGPEDVPTAAPIPDSDYIRVHRSDLEKVRHALDKGNLYFKRLNEMNAALHLSDPSYSPLTGTIGNALTRVDQLLDGVNSEAG